MCADAYLYLNVYSLILMCICCMYLNVSRRGVYASGAAAVCVCTVIRIRITQGSVNHDDGLELFIWIIKVLSEGP